MTDGLTAEELAYMRETQADHRPTEAVLSRRTSGRTATGGESDDWVGDDPVAVRLNSAPDKVPEALANRYGLAGLVHCSMDLVHDVRAGDRLTVTPVEVYEVVTEGEPDAWTTAQIVWLNRLTYPPRE